MEYKQDILFKNKIGTIENKIFVAFSKAISHF